MSSQAEPSSFVSEEFFVRCKCRFNFDLRPDQVVDLEQTSHIYLHEDRLPQWIEEKVTECGWTKTKLHCPSCGARVGGVDFVGGADHPVHLIRSKVDLAMSAEAREELLKKLRPSAVVGSGVVDDDSSENSSSGEEEAVAASSTTESASTELSSQAMGSQSADISNSSNDVIEIEVTFSSTDIDDSDISIADTSGSSSPAVTTSPEEPDMGVVDEADHVEVSVDDDERDEGLLSRRRKNKLRLKRRRLEKLKAERSRRKATSSTTLTQDNRIKTIMEAEPELDCIDDNLICPVCLDLLYEPHRVDPCRHIFCEPCLRRLGSKNPMNTSCPMCRQRIVFCDPQRDTSVLIRENYHSMHIKRKKFERSTNVFTLPLPWRPGWRNLIYGRAMGGNRIVHNSNSEMVRQFLQQLPYYIPPVVIANIINLLFFICLLGAVEIVPLLCSLILGRGPMGILSAVSKSGLPAPAEPVGSGGDPLDIEQSAVGEAGQAYGQASDLLSDDDGDISSTPDILADDISITTAMPPIFAMPEATSPALDATFYYVICIMSLVAAAFGNIIIIQQQPLLAMLPRGTFLDRLYAHPTFGRYARRFVDIFLILILTCGPLLFLPFLLPNLPPVIPAADTQTSDADNDAGEATDRSDVLKLNQWLSDKLYPLSRTLLLLIDRFSSIVTAKTIIFGLTIFYIVGTAAHQRRLRAL